MPPSQRASVSFSALLFCLCEREREREERKRMVSVYDEVERVNAHILVLKSPTRVVVVVVTIVIKKERRGHVLSPPFGSKEEKTK